MNDLWYRISGSLTDFYLFLSLFSLLIALPAAWIVKHRFSDNYTVLFLFFLVFNIIAPFIGAFMTLWIVYYLRTVQYQKLLTNTNIIDMNAFYSEFPEIQRIFGEASMGHILSSDTISDSLKMKALVSLTDRTGKNEIALIKETLSDRNDEIRLYSFAIIDKLERNINNRLHLELEQYQAMEGKAERAELAKEIAHLYWEMIYFELADEDLKRFIASEVDRYATEALQSHPDDPALNTLLGKCCLMVYAYDRSQSYFGKLLSQHGIRRDAIIPYLAELHYAKHEYGQVRELMQSAERLRSNQLLNPIVELWHREEK